MQKIKVIGILFVIHVIGIYLISIIYNMGGMR